MQSEGVTLHQHNACPHGANRTWEKIDELRLGATDNLHIALT